MAFVQNNQFTKGLSGSVGNIIFRQIGNKTVVSVKRKQPVGQSDQQRENRFRFKCASSWAKVILLDAEKKSYYTSKAKKLKLPNAYTAAISDYMRKGEVQSVDVRNYKGKSGNVIRINARKKDFAVNKIQVTLYDVQGKQIESDKAIKKDANVFIYKALQTIPDMLGVSIEVVITDHNMNVISKRFCINKQQFI